MSVTLLHNTRSRADKAPFSRLPGSLPQFMNMAVLEADVDHVLGVNWL